MPKAINWYNAKQKWEFIQFKLTETLYDDSIKTFFSKIAPFEKMVDLDFAKFSYEEMVAVFKAMRITTIGGFGTILGVAKTYLNWAIQKGYTQHTENCLYGIQYETWSDYLGGYDNCMYGSPEHLKEVLDDRFPPITHNNKLNIYRCAIWLSYIGVSDVDSVELKLTDIDWTNNIISYQDKKIPIPDYAANDLRYFYCQDVFYSTESDSDSEIIKSYERQGEYFLSGKSRNISRQTLADRISIINRQYLANTGCNNPITLKKVFRSGFYWRIYQWEQEHNEIISQEDAKFLWQFTDNITRLFSIHWRAEYEKWLSEFH